jgi:hypothetical protein
MNECSTPTREKNMENEDMDRVRRVGSKEVNRRIDEEIQENIQAFTHKDAEAIGSRIRELEKEWDIERAIEANASSLALTGLALGAFVNRRWLLLPAAVAGFLLQHALQGWCPPVPVLRRLGFRTRQEIDREKSALKALRGDYRELIGASKQHGPAPAGSPAA